MTLEIQGSQTKAIVYTENLDEGSYAQILSMTCAEAFAGKKMRIMPDVHLGKGSVIGFTCELSDKVIPQVIGVDIGCGVVTCPIPPVEDFEKLDRFLKDKIPTGNQLRNKNWGDRNFEQLYQKFISSSKRDSWKNFEKELIELVNITKQNLGSVLCSLGTLGGGNHFIEIDVDEDRKHYLTIHTGSRNFGLRICEYHMKQAQKHSGKREDHLSWLENEEAELYFEHMKIAQKYAQLNRYVILEIILSLYFKEHLFQKEPIESIHNYIDFKDNIIRKGAISAHRGEKVVIPWNMAEGLVIGEGLGNEEWNFSAPHGAGRLLSRNQAKKDLDMEIYKERMEGVWSSCIHEKTLDESPMAYKNAEEIQNAIGDTVRILKKMKPVYNLKDCQ